MTSLVCGKSRELATFLKPVMKQYNKNDHDRQHGRTKVEAERGKGMVRSIVGLHSLFLLSCWGEVPTGSCPPPCERSLSSFCCSLLFLSRRGSQGIHFSFLHRMLCEGNRKWLPILGSFSGCFFLKQT